MQVIYCTWVQSFVTVVPCMPIPSVTRLYTFVKACCKAGCRQGGTRGRDIVRVKNFVGFTNSDSSNAIQQLLRLKNIPTPSQELLSTWIQKL